MSKMFITLLGLLATSQAQLFHELPDRPFKPNESNNPTDRASRYINKIYTMKLEQQNTFLMTQAFPGADILSIYERVFEHVEPALPDADGLSDMFVEADHLAMQHLCYESYMPAYNATQSFITAFNSFYSIRFMAGWYKEYNFIEELTDDTCINYHEFEEFLTRWTGYFGEEFQKNYFAYKKQTLNLARANVEFEHQEEWQFLDLEMAGMKHSTCLEIWEIHYNIFQHFRVFGGIKSQEFLKYWVLTIIQRMREFKEIGGY